MPERERESTLQDADAHSEGQLQQERTQHEIGRRAGDGTNETPDPDGTGLEIGGGKHGDPEEECAAAHGDADGNREGRDAGAYLEPLVGLAIARGERSAWTYQPGVGRMVYGVSNRVHRIAALGRAVVPQVAEWIGYQIIEAVKQSKTTAKD